MQAPANKQMKWNVAKLKEYPKQKHMFGDLSESEFAALVADIKKNRMRHPPEILPDGTVVTGNQRVRAARFLGYKEIDVIVLHGLAAEDAAVETLFIADNLHRRQLSILARARCIERLMEISAGDRGLSFPQRDALRAKIGKQFGISARTVSRYLLLLQIPSAIQQAFDRNEISLVAAGKVAHLEKGEQDEIASRVEAGENAAKVATEYLHKPSKRHRKATPAFDSLMRGLRDAHDDLDGRVEAVSWRRVVEGLPDLKKAQALIDALLARGEKNAKDSFGEKQEAQAHEKLMGKANDWLTGSDIVPKSETTAPCHRSGVDRKAAG